MWLFAVLEQGLGVGFLSSAAESDANYPEQHNDHLQGLGKTNGPKQVLRRFVPCCDISALILKMSLEIWCLQLLHLLPWFVFLPSHSIMIMTTEKVALFNGALWHDCNDP